MQEPMSIRLNPQAISLKQNLEALVGWMESQPQEKFPVPQLIMQGYEHWDQFRQAFIAFVESKSPYEWTPEEFRLFSYVIRLDWQAHQLLKELPPDKLYLVLSQDYRDQSVRVYMLANLKMLPDIASRQQIAYKLYANADTDAIRDQALIILAATGWPDAEEQAIKDWNSGDPIKRLVALNCLNAARSPLLEEYLDLALQSDEHSLRTVALSIKQSQ